MRTIIFEHITDEWYEGDNPNALDNYDSNQVTIDVTAGNWWDAVDGFIRFLKTSGFTDGYTSGPSNDPVSEESIIEYLGGYTRKQVEALVAKVKEEEPAPVYNSPGNISAWEYDG